MKDLKAMEKFQETVNNIDSLKRLQAMSNIIERRIFNVKKDRLLRSSRSGSPVLNMSEPLTDQQESIFENVSQSIQSIGRNK